MSVCCSARRPLGCAGGSIVTRVQCIPAAENSRLIHELTERVIEVAERDAAALFAVRPDFRISIDVSSSDVEERRVMLALQALGRVTAGTPGRFMVFIDSIGTGAANLQGVQYITAMAKALDLGLIAEGVESVAQLGACVRMACRRRRRGCSDGP